MLKTPNNFLHQYNYLAIYNDGQTYQHIDYTSCNEKNSYSRMSGKDGKNIYKNENRNTFYF